MKTDPRPLHGTAYVPLPQPLPGPGRHGHYGDFCVRIRQLETGLLGLDCLSRLPLPRDATDQLRGLP